MTDYALTIGFDRLEKEKRVLLPTDVLKSHMVIGGESGSGKTILTKVIIEECVRMKIPIILIDLHGDLSSLALMGDKMFTESKGVSGSIYDDYQAKAQVAIFNPVSTKGIPISMNPLKSPPNYLDYSDLIYLRDSIAEIVTSILGYDPSQSKGEAVKKYLYLLLEEIWNQEITIEKFTDLAKLIANESSFLDRVGQGILDDKTKSSIYKKIKSMSIGVASLLFNFGMPFDVDKMMNWNHPGKVPINVLYLNNIRNHEDKINFIANTALQIYTWMYRNPSSEVQLIFALEEIDDLMPLVGNPPTKRIFQLLLEDAKKFGISLLLATRNLYQVDLKLLREVRIWAFGRLMMSRNKEKVKEIVSNISRDNVDDILSTVSQQRPGQFMLLAPQVYASVQKIVTRWLVTNHVTLDEFGIEQIMDQTGIRLLFPEAYSERRSK